MNHLKWKNIRRLTQKSQQKNLKIELPISIRKKNILQPSKSLKRIQNTTLNETWKVYTKLIKKFKKCKNNKNWKMILQKQKQKWGLESCQNTLLNFNNKLKRTGLKQWDKSNKINDQEEPCAFHNKKLNQ